MADKVEYRKINVGRITGLNSYELAVKHGFVGTEEEYVEKEIGGNTLYCLYPSSPLYKKIYNKVIEETGLKDGGRLYDLEQKRNNITKTLKKVEEIRINTKNNTPKNNRRSNMGDDMYF